MKKLAIFGLDGILLNTTVNLAHSMDHALWQNDPPAHDIKEYNFFVENGINKLFERALLEGEKAAENILKVRREFLKHYDLYNTDRSVPYPGIPGLLVLLQERGIKLAVASNEYQAATRKLTAYFFPPIQPTEILGQRERVKAKSDPSIINEIVEWVSISKEGALYVGDSDIDIQTIINSEVTSYGVTWGFRPRMELEKYTPDHIAEKVEDILKFI